MLKRLVGKVSLITGATDGIGFECARRLGLEGSAVVITGRDEQRLDTAVKKLQGENVEVTGIQGHVGDSSHRKDVVKQMLDKYGHCDNLVNSAGVNPLNSSLLEVSESKWDHVLNVNVKAAWHFTQMVVPSMIERGTGSIVLISSQSGQIPGYYHEFPVYGISKAALDAIAKMLSPELGQHTIRINSLACGYFETKFAKFIKETDHVYRDAMGMMCIRRPGKPEEAGAYCAFLCSDEGAWVTGQVVGLNGGYRAR